MATRRTAAGQKAAAGGGQETEKPSDIRPAVPTDVIYKLLFFTFAMVTVPIGSYFLTLNLIFKGNSTFAGATAAVMANVVLITYIVVAYQEDQSEQAAESKKAQ